MKLTLTILVLFFLSGEARPYSTYGFSYSPFPPPPDQQVLYEFSPLEQTFNEDSENSNKAQSRSTRDLNFDDYDAFLDGSREPTCQELREMWNMAKRIRQRAIETNEIPQQVHPFFKEQDQKDEMRTDRRRMSVPTLRNINRKNIKDNNEDKDVMHVRDPAKEIYGLLKERDTESSTQVKPEKHIFGQVKTHQEKNENEGRQGKYFDMIRNEMYPGSDQKGGDKSIAFGSVRQHQSDKPYSSSFDQVRDMLNAQKTLDEDEDEQEDPFEAIRQKLMSSSHRRIGSGRKTDRLFRKGLRRKTAKNRRRNVSQHYLML